MSVSFSLDETMPDTPDRMPPRREWRIDKHQLLFEPPDLLHVRFDGSCSLREVIRMEEIYQELATTAGPFFVMYDMAAATGMDPDARQYVGEQVRPEWILGYLYFNTRLVHRAIALGLALASEMLQSERSSRRAKTHFTSTKDKAEALLARLRAQRGRG